MKSLITKLTPHLNRAMRFFISQYGEVPDYASHGGVPVQRLACIELFNTIADDVMREFVLSPSKMNSKKKLFQLAETLNSLFESTR